LHKAAELYRKVHIAVREGWIKSCHDISDGGTLVSIAESVIGSGLGADISLTALKQAATACDGSAHEDVHDRNDFAFFAEGPARLVVSVQPELREDWEAMWAGFTCVCIGEVVQQDSLTVTDDAAQVVVTATLKDMVAAWKTPLPFD
jgi:phosphoribosylformylglycinamidine synthase